MWRVGAWAVGLAVLAGPQATSMPVDVPAVEVAGNDPGLSRRGNQQLLNGVAFSGYLTEAAGSARLTRTGYWLGLREGVALAWHPNGQLALERYYRRDRRTGTHRGWWPNGQLQFERSYRHDLFHGTQRSWYASGVLFEVGQFVDGKEDGRQTQYDPDGRIVANYVVRSGRRYGVVGRFDCSGVGGH